MNALESGDALDARQSGPWSLLTIAAFAVELSIRAQVDSLYHTVAGKAVGDFESDATIPVLCKVNLFE